jgi:IS30 family transposase
MSKHLSYPERCIIEKLLNEGKNCSQIGKVIERDKSTVLREVKRIITTSKLVVCIDPIRVTNKHSP